MKHGWSVVLACLLATPAFSAETDGTVASGAEQHFINKATQDSMTEVQLGQLAQRRSSDAAVKAFGARMVKDHSKAAEDLRALAARKQIEAPNQLDGEHSRIVHSLSAKPDSEFDSEYARRMTEAQETAIVTYSDAAALSDKDISAFARKTLPALKEHQKLAVALPAKTPEPQPPPLEHPAR